MLNHKKENMMVESKTKSEKFKRKGLDDSGRKTISKGGITFPHTLNVVQAPLKPKIELTEKQTEKMKESLPKKNIEIEIIDCIEFVNGKNKLKIQFSKKTSRIFNVKIMLNDEIELKPLSFVTKSLATDSWEMLKRVLQK
jgi:hypothetical protein